MLGKNSLISIRNFGGLNIDRERLYQEYVNLIKLYQPNFNLTLASLLKELRDPQKINFARFDESDNSLIAIAQATKPVFNPYRQLFINRFCVHPGHTYRNYGFACLNILEQRGLPRLLWPKGHFQFVVRLPDDQYVNFFVNNGYEYAYLDGEELVYVKNV